jgi:hypothetical protein
VSREKLQAYSKAGWKDVENTSRIHRVLKYGAATDPDPKEREMLADMHKKGQVHLARRVKYLRKADKKIG